MAYFVALKPEKLTQRLGRILCPALLVLIVVLFAGCILRPAASGYGTPAEAYAALPAAQGVLDGYQTMDALAALNFGAVIALNIRTRGIDEEGEVRRGTISAGLIAGALLLAVYSMLTHAGALSGAAFPGGATGADTLTSLALGLFGLGRSDAACGDLRDCLLQHLRRPDLVRRPVFSRAAASPLSCRCRPFSP